MKQKREQSSSAILSYDPLTEQIGGLLNRIPRIGKHAADLYFWKHMLFNYMLVGATGTFLNWFIYEMMIRPLVYWFWGGTFLGVTITTVLVFFWNYTWNKKWSLKSDSQIMGMKRLQLLDLQEKITVLLNEKRDYTGQRVSR
jgi:hypothetical protein